MALSEQELEKVADKIHARMQQVHHGDFWIPPEDHYNQHKDLKDLLQDWKLVKGTFFKVFLGFAIVGAIVAAGLGAAWEFVKSIGKG